MAKDTKISQNQNTNSLDPNVQQEAQIEEQLINVQPMGNAGAQENLNLSGSNEANIENLNEILEEADKKQDGKGEAKDADWKPAASERLKKTKLLSGISPEETAKFQAEEMRKIKNWDFVSEKQSSPKKDSKIRKFWSWLAGGVGKMFSYLNPLQAFQGLFKKKGSKKGSQSGVAKRQKLREHSGLGWSKI